MTERDTELMYAGISAARVPEPLRICEACPARLSPTNRKGKCRRCQSKLVAPLRGEGVTEPKAIPLSEVPLGASEYANRGRAGTLWQHICRLGPGEALEIPCRDDKHRADTAGNLRQIARRHKTKLSTRSLGTKVYVWLERGGASAR